MDDFRVGSVPPSESYGDRHAYDAAARRRQKHHHNEHGDEPEEDAADTFEASSDGEKSAAPDGGEIEDFYRPTEPPGDE